MADPNRQQQLALAKQKFMVQLGKSGIIMTNGVISREEYNKELTGPKGLEIYNKMRRSDGTVRAALMIVKLPILAADWRVEAATVDGKEAEVDEAFKVVKYSLFDNANWDDMLREILTMLDFGYSVFEIVLEVAEVEGREYVVLKDLAFRKQSSIIRWSVKREGTSTDATVGETEPGITQMNTGGKEVGIPWIKLSVFTYDKEGDNHEGVSLLRAAYKHWYMKDTLYQIDAIAHEKQGLGVLKVKVPKGAKKEDREEAKEVAREQRANEEAFIEELEDFEFDFMDMKARTTREIMPSITHHDRQILVSVLAQFLTIGSESSSGSFAASNDQTDMFVMSEEATAKVVQGVLQDTLVRVLMALNGFSPEVTPKVTYGRIGQDNIDAFSKALNALFTSGVLTPDQELEAHIRKMLHLPDMSQEMLDNYDDIRAKRKNPGLNPQPGLLPVDTSTAATDGLKKMEAAELIKQARAMRDKLRRATDAAGDSAAA